MILVGSWIVVGFFSAIGWYGANYYVITPYLPEPVYKEKRVEEVKAKQDDTKQYYPQNSGLSAFIPLYKFCKPMLKFNIGEKA